MHKSFDFYLSWFSIAIILLLLEEHNLYVVECFHDTEGIALKLKMTYNEDSFRFLSIVFADATLVPPLQSTPPVMNSPLEINNGKLVNILKPKVNFVLLSLAFGS